MKVLHLPTDTGNLGPLMAREMRAMGHESWSIAFARNYLDYGADEVFGGRSIKELLMVEIKRWKVFIRAIQKYDAIVFNYGSTIFPNPIFIGWGLSSKFKPRFRMLYSILSLPFSLFMWDVALLHFLGKKIGVVFQGGDARQGSILREQGRLDITEEPEGYYTRWMDRIKQRRAKLWDKYADAIWFHNPDLWHGLPMRSTFLPYPIEVKDMGKPFVHSRDALHIDEYTDNSCGETPAPIPIRTTGRLRIGHIVNHREPKGTRFVLDAVHQVRMDGGDFAFLFAERYEHDEAKLLYERIDVLLEQFTIGWYGLQACELALMGKPVVVFMDERDKPQLPMNLWEDCPFIKATIHTLPDVLKWILAMPRSTLLSLGLQGREYVKKWHDSRSVAKQMIDDLEQPKKSWW